MKESPYYGNMLSTAHQISRIIKYQLHLSNIKYQFIKYHFYVVFIIPFHTFLFSRITYESLITHSPSSNLTSRIWFYAF